MKYMISLICGIGLLLQSAYAGNYSYVYIEGDKQTPFYVKLEGQMQPRLGKNHCILPNLAAGVSYIEILFPQNAFPPQKFAINIPEAGSRGFVLQKVNDRQFALYDIQQKNYIVSGNKPEEDHIPEPGQQQVAAPVAGNAAATTAGTASAATTPVAAATGDEGIPAFRPAKKKTKATPARTATEEPAAQETRKDDRFLNNIELNSDGTPVAGTAAGTVADPVPPMPKPAKSRKKAPKKQQTEETDLAAIKDDTEFPDPAASAKEERNEPGVPNSDCKTAMSSDDFENFALKILDKSDDDARIKVLSKSKGRHCFTTEQVRIIANNLDTQSGRLDVVKMLYAQTSDQSNYPKLESLFKTSFLKEKFRQIISPN